jgi:hypothetical protein
LAVVLGTGLVHGLWTSRWGESDALAEAARGEGLPGQAGDWAAGEPEALDPRALRLAGAEGHWVRRYVNGRTGESVTVLLLCGRAGPMAVHRPEHCYGSAGYEMTRPAVRVPVAPGASFWAATFRKPEATGPVVLRILWAWRGAGGWEAPDSPRLTLARCPVVCKMYVIHALAGAEDRPGEGPCVGFLRQLLPVLK